MVAAFDVVNELCGHQCQLAAMATDPDWVRDMGGVYTGVSIDMLEMLFAREGLPDGLWVWDDLGFKHRPFMSPGMYGELIFPGISGFSTSPTATSCRWSCIATVLSSRWCRS